MNKYKGKQNQSISEVINILVFKEILLNCTKLEELGFKLEEDADLSMIKA